MITIMNESYIVTKNDLKGDIEYFPIEVVEKMIEEQVKQGNKADVEVFQKQNDAGGDKNGFVWSITDDGYVFWVTVIRKRNFDWFFKKYPKKPKLVYIVGNSDIGMDIIKTLENYGGINRNHYTGNYDSCVYYIEPNNNTIEICDFEDDKKLYEVILETYTPIKAEKFILEVSMEEIAEKFGVDVSNLRIKE